MNQMSLRQLWIDLCLLRPSNKLAFAMSDQGPVDLGQPSLRAAAVTLDNSSTRTKARRSPSPIVVPAVQHPVAPGLAYARFWNALDVRSDSG